MPVGCGMWPAFWLTDEHNWPINGEIDVIEGINYQSEAKTAMHTTGQCTMSHETLGHATGWWDSVMGVPNGKTGLPDMTMRFATDCYVYDAHQWLNQGCVAVDLEVRLFRCTNSCCNWFFFIIFRRIFFLIIC